MEVLNRLSESGLTDQSDPDVDIPNVYHGFQTAEGIRKVHPDKGWFQLTGLIHDVGKVGACKLIEPPPPPPEPLVTR
jgi:inositol oxygenase